MKLAHLYSYFTIMDISLTLPPHILSELQPLIATTIETDRLLTGKTYLLHTILDVKAQIVLLSMMSSSITCNRRDAAGASS